MGTAIWRRSPASAPDQRRGAAEGFELALSHAGLEAASGYLQKTTFDRVDGYAKTKILLRMLPCPTAILACNDMIALGALLAIREEKLRCPEDISLIGFDRLDLTEVTTPQLSSVNQSAYQIGAIVAQMALDRIADQTCPVRQIVLEAELKIREFMAPLPQTAKPAARPSLKKPRKHPLVAPRRQILIGCAPVAWRSSVSVVGDCRARGRRATSAVPLAAQYPVSSLGRIDNNSLENCVLFYSI